MSRSSAAALGKLQSKPPIARKCAFGITTLLVAKKTSVTLSGKIVRVQVVDQKLAGGGKRIVLQRIFRAAAKRVIRKIFQLPCKLFQPVMRWKAIIISQSYILTARVLDTEVARYAWPGISLANERQIQRVPEFLHD